MPEVLLLTLRGVDGQVGDADIWGFEYVRAANLYVSRYYFRVDFNNFVLPGLDDLAALLAANLDPRGIIKSNVRDRAPILEPEARVVSRRRVEQQSRSNVDRDHLFLARLDEYAC